jgi:hypothetical protein
MAEFREQIADYPATAYERSDWRLGIIGLVFLAILALLVVGPLALLLAFPGVMPDVGRHRTVEPPAPRLQLDPPRDLARFRADEDRRLNTTYWIDRKRGIVHIPIARAMQELVERGIDGFPQGRP